MACCAISNHMGIMLSENVRERQILYAVTYMWNLKYNTNEPIYETETDSQRERTDLWLPRKRGWGNGGLRVWGWQMQSIIYRKDKQQGPTG